MKSVVSSYSKNFRLSRKYCLRDIYLTERISIVHPKLLFYLRKLHNAHNTRKAVEDNVFAALDHEGIFNSRYIFIPSNNLQAV